MHCFQAGCDDATISVCSGRIYITFSRVAASLKDAILRAIRDVESTKICAEVLDVDTCNLVTQADIARKIGRTPIPGIPIHHEPARTKRVSRASLQHHRGIPAVVLV